MAPPDWLAVPVARAVSWEMSTTRAGSITHGSFLAACIPLLCKDCAIPQTAEDMGARFAALMA
jgi:hypothetical protein